MIFGIVISTNKYLAGVISNFDIKNNFVNYKLPF